MNIAAATAAAMDLSLFPHSVHTCSSSKAFKAWWARDSGAQLLMWLLWVKPKVIFKNSQFVGPFSGRFGILRSISL